MKISGYTVIRNAGLMGYPVQQSIRSLLPLVDELVVGIGQSEDNTKEIIAEINDPKIKTFDSVWDTSKTTDGLILSEKSNEALQRCENDWCFYLQADEVLHEEDYSKIRNAVEKYDDNKDVQGLLFDWVHFYGSYHTVATSKQWYRHEIRLIRRSSGAQSYRDAQGFRINGKELKVKRTDARVFHYGWVKPPQVMGRKARMLDFWWHGERENKDNEFRYDSQYGLKVFPDSHPSVMKDLVAQQDWDFVPNRKWSDWTVKDIRYWATDAFEGMFGFRPGEYKPYKII